MNDRSRDDRMTGFLGVELEPKRSACSIPAFKNAESYIGEIARFFRFSGKRQYLENQTTEVCDST